MMVKVNKQRGEAALDLGGKAYRLVPTYTNLVALEDATGMGLIEMVVHLSEGAVRINTLAKAVAAVAEPEVDEETIGQHMAEQGVSDALGQLAMFLVNALSGGKEEEQSTGKKKAVKRKA